MAVELPAWLQQLRKQYPGIKLPSCVEAVVKDQTLILRYDKISRSKLEQIIEFSDRYQLVMYCMRGRSKLEIKIWAPGAKIMKERLLKEIQDGEKL